jgi:acyl dehydratase
MHEGPSGLYFDDVAVEATLVSSAMQLERDTVIAFACQWDPLPVHLDDAAARAAGFDGLTASGTHLLAIKHRLLYDFGFEQTVIASFGFDEIRFRAPAYPGDVLQVRLRWIEKRLSTSRPGTGIAKHFCELTRGDGTVLLSLFDTILMRCRARSEEEQGA